MRRDDKTSQPAPRPVVADHGRELAMVQRTVTASGGCGETVTIVVRVERGCCQAGGAAVVIRRDRNCWLS